MKEQKRPRENKRRQGNGGTKWTPDGRMFHFIIDGVHLENIMFVSGEGWRMFKLFLLVNGIMLGAGIEHVETTFQPDREKV